MIYYIMNVAYTWFMVGLFYGAYAIAIKQEYGKGTSARAITGDLLVMFYFSLLITVFIASLAVKPKRVEGFFKGVCYVMGVYQIYITILIVQFIIDTNGTSYVLPLFAAGIGSFALIVIINCEIFTVFRGTFHFLFMIPTYVNIFLIYSICNIHDCTWGNRPDTLSNDEKERLEEFEEFRSRWTALWTLSNGFLGYVILVISDLTTTDSNGTYYLIAITGAGFIIIAIRVVGGLFYWIAEFCKKSIKEKHEVIIPALLRASTYAVVNPRNSQIVGNS